MGLEMYLTYQNDEDPINWSKANQIHSWFVRNIQNGIDDGDVYKVTLENLQSLLAICKLVKEHSELITSKIVDGTNDDDEENDMMDGLKIIKDPTYAKKYLPTMEGFFFGSTEYDEDYLSDIEYTIERLEQIIKDIESGNLKCDKFYYGAWW